MSGFAYDLAPDGAAPLGLLVLQTDETIEADMRRMLPGDQPLFVSRVPAAAQVSSDSLRRMHAALRDAAALLPDAQRFAAVGYGCTSASAEIGSDAVAAQVRAGVDTDRVTDPLAAVLDACAALQVRRLALVSPYVAQVSERLRSALRGGGVETPLFGSFDEPLERNVVRIDAASLQRAAGALAGRGGVDAIFLSCTNLRTLDVIERIEADTGLPCLSSNQVLARHLTARARVPGTLGRALRGGAG